MLTMTPLRIRVLQRTTVPDRDLLEPATESREERNEY